MASKADKAFPLKGKTINLSGKTAKVSDKSEYQRPLRGDTINLSGKTAKVYNTQGQTFDPPTRKKK